MAVGKNEIDLHVADDAFGRNTVAELLMLFLARPDLTLAFAGIVEILLAVAETLELLVEIDISAIGQPRHYDNVQRRVEDLAQGGMAGAQARLDLLYLRDVPRHRDHARLAFDFDHRSRNQIRLDVPVLAPLRDLHVLDAAGFLNLLEKQVHLLFVGPHPKRDDAAPNHVVARVAGDLVVVVDGNETSVGKAVDCDAIRRGVEHLAQHGLAGLQPSVIAFACRRDFGAQVHFPDEQAMVPGESCQLLGQFLAIAGAMNCSYLRQDQRADHRRPVVSHAQSRVRGVHRVADHRNRSAHFERHLPARTPRKHRACAEGKQHNRRDQRVAVAVDHRHKRSARDNRRKD